MTINEAIDEWAELTTSRKFEVFNNLMREVLWKHDDESDEIYNFLQYYAELEAEDSFGTEGLKV